MINIFEKRKPHVQFRKILQYCKLMNYDIDEILDMSDNELRLWYKRINDIVNDEMNFRIKTGIDIDKTGKKHKLVSIVDGRVIKK